MSIGYCVLGKINRFPVSEFFGVRADCPQASVRQPKRFAFPNQVDKWRMDLITAKRWESQSSMHICAIEAEQLTTALLGSWQNQKDPSRDE
ncbi:hypothetical protein HZH68_016941 [Vespula germanica]|uniref:Uncharacterized protein n=1 Tax=Vespula germanica TaxID=30212 RepID=A0A834J4Z3_VESGE|nr:hypothetical protein HZH68_016941 [Vespula germanica]